MSMSGKRVPYLLIGVVSILAIVLSALPTTHTSADATGLTSRSLTLEDGTDPGSKASGTVNHLFTFTIPQNTNGTIGSISFQYCTTADINIGGVCTTPHGLDTKTSTTLGAGSSASISGLVNTTQGDPYVTTSPAIDPSGADVTVSVELDSVVNPDATDCAGTNGNCTFFVRISAFSSADASGTALDAGTVAAAVTQQIVLTGTMPESLIFCTGGEISENANSIPDCSTATSGEIKFPMLFSPSATAYVTSQMAASTNALHGYAITVEGTTLQSGINKIKAIGATGEASSIGTPQFGMNLVKDDGTVSGPDVTTIQTQFGAGYANSADITPTSATPSLLGQAVAPFASNGSFAFDDTSPNTIADSGFSTDPDTPAPTDAQIYTATYIVNVDGAQPAGTYKTTLTYICTPTF